ncbi:CoA-binding protein [Demequina silvatica]|uniref:CoA-binding protein n=1 Tax=Demequina silvatica TaxID=1638988 RepID=UPI0007844CEC|nr:CoA-binding protein [Demequina silvatica]
MEHMRLDPTRKAHAETCPAPVLTDVPGDDELALALARTHRVAIVGASPNPSRTSYQIAVWLMENTPYELYLVNPAAAGEEIRGHGFYASLADLPVPVDMVDVFRRAEFTPSIAADTVGIGAKALWLQLGISHPDAMSTARCAGLVAVQNRCIKVEYRRLEDRIASFRAL